LSVTPDKNVYLPASDDVIFNGDPAKWIKAAWVLKARYANRISKRDPNSATNVLHLPHQCRYDRIGSMI
jgi:hypothetical protein